MDIKSIVKEGSAEFTHYQNGELWYQTPSGFSFPVPLNDLGNARINKTEKPLLLMRYIRKHSEVIEDGRQDLVH